MAVETDSQKIARLERDIETLKSENERLRRMLEEAIRSGKRQAAPFSRREPKANPNKPGRKPGKSYGRRCRRPIPETIDEVLDAPLPQQCPQCGGRVQETGVVSQYQTEIPAPRVEKIEFRIHVGECEQCKQRVQGRHPRQTSSATGSAASQVGPRALALATYLNKGLGLSCGKTTNVLEQGFGLKLSRGGLCQALHRVAHKAEPTYESLVEKVRAAPSVTPDETGWKVGGRLQWMWVFASEQITVYTILPGRGFEQAATVLGANFDGFLVRDGWSVYRQFTQALHQSCVAHLLRRCREMIQVAEKGKSAQLPSLVQQVLQQALQLRDRSNQGQISDHGLVVAQGRLEARLDRALEKSYRSLQNQRLAKHLLRERDALFTFLCCPGLDATNYRAEQAIRPMVVARKVWGGNRTEAGARTQSVLGSILQTCRQQLRSFTSCVQELLHSPQPKVIDFTPSDR